VQSLKTKSSRPKPKSFETETRPETFETETPKNGSRDSITDSLWPTIKFYNCNYDSRYLITVVHF